MRLMFDVHMSPGIPMHEQLHRMFELLVVDRPLFQPVRRLRSDGPDLQMATAATELATHVESGKQGVQLVGDSEYPFMGAVISKSPKFASGIRGYLVDADLTTVMDKMHDLFDVVSANLVRVEARGSAGENLNARNSEARAAVKARYGGSAGAHWPHYLLCGLGHRMILSEQLVDFLGTDRVAALPEELAWRENGRQIIAGTQEPSPLPTNCYDPQEKMIIEALGATDAFFNPETGELPRRVPELKPARPIRFWNDDGLYTVR